MNLFLQVCNGQFIRLTTRLSPSKEKYIFNGHILLSIDALLGLFKPLLNGWIEPAVCVVVEPIPPDRTVMYLVVLTHLVILLPNRRWIGLILQEEVEVRHRYVVVGIGDGSNRHTLHAKGGAIQIVGLADEVTDSATHFGTGSSAE
jgi:hypothetical protein